MVSIMKLPTTTRKLNWEECAPYLMEPEPEVDEHESDGTKEGSGAEAPCNDDKENKMRQVRLSTKLRSRITVFYNYYKKMMTPDLIIFS